MEPTIQAAAQTYISTALSLHYSPQTQIAYGQALSLFHVFLRTQRGINPDATTIDRMHIEWGIEFVKHLQQTRSIETEHLYSRALLHFYQHIRDFYQIPLNVEQLEEAFSHLRRPKPHHIPDIPLDAIKAVIDRAQNYIPTTPLDPSQERNYLRLLRDRAFLLMLADTGLRISEICNLRRHHVNNAEQLLHITPDLSLHLPKRVTHALHMYLSARHKMDSNQRLLPSEHLPLYARHDKRAGKHVLPISRWTGANIIDYWVSQTLPPDKQVELTKPEQTITPHTFRHYFVLMTLTETGDITTTRSLARHKDPATTRRYIQSLRGLGKALGEKHR